ncbi:MAG: OmpA family protein [Akkermansiaceae bacterium]|nr:OmpA family protein [Akkermansiaceae bacterium]
MKRIRLSTFLIALSVIIAIAAVVIWVERSREIRERADSNAQQEEQPIKDPDSIPNGDGGVMDPADPMDPDPPKLDIDALRQAESPELLMQEMARALNQLDMERFERLSGGSIESAELAALRRFATEQKAEGRDLQLREVGETDLDDGRRWALDGKRDGELMSFYLDMKRGEGGWRIDQLTLPSEGGELANDDALAAAEAFVLALLSQNFEAARQYVDGRKVSDARIAGLCIIFEEGNYALRKQKPLRLMVKRDGLASYLANVVTPDGSEKAQFGLNLVQRGDPARWLVSEINLDKLLADYAQRVAGGDVYYSPLVRNPEGGDTLALYFGFDEDEINPRTQRQLEIVAAILKADPVKKLTLSGHTDSMGTDAYNRELSRRRAEAVKAFLLDAGVKAPQIVTLAKGDSEPRRPNVTESGEDNPEGRRANRRTEIYLDF